MSDKVKCYPPPGCAACEPGVTLDIDVCTAAGLVFRSVVPIITEVGFPKITSICVNGAPFSPSTDWNDAIHAMTVCCGDKLNFSMEYEKNSWCVIVESVVRANRLNPGEPSASYLGPDGPLAICRAIIALKDRE